MRWLFRFAVHFVRPILCWGVVACFGYLATIKIIFAVVGGNEDDVALVQEDVNQGKEKLARIEMMKERMRRSACPLQKGKRIAEPSSDAETIPIDVCVVAKEKSVPVFRLPKDLSRRVREVAKEQKVSMPDFVFNVLDRAASEVLGDKSERRNIQVRTKVDDIIESKSFGCDIPGNIVLRIQKAAKKKGMTTDDFITQALEGVLASAGQKE